MRRTGEGSTGAQTSGNSRRAAVRRNMPALIRAKDVLMARARGIGGVSDDLVEVCRIATESPSLLTPWQYRMVYAGWIELAEAGHLRGIRNAVKHDVCEVT